MRTILYIVVFKFFLVGVVFGQKIIKPVITYSKISESEERGYIKSRIVQQRYENRKLFIDLKFGAHCEDDSIVASVVEDTLLLDLAERVEKTKKKPRIVYPGNGICNIDINIEIEGLERMPKFVRFGLFIYDSIDGFVSRRRYDKVTSMNRQNDSKTIIYKELTLLLGQSIESDVAKKTMSKLGSDSTWYSELNLRAIDYNYDHVWIDYNSENLKIFRIMLNNGFNGELPNSIKFGMTEIEVLDLMGKPTKRDKVMIGELTEEHDYINADLVRYIYKKLNLVLIFNTKGTLQDIRVTKNSI